LLLRAKKHEAGGLARVGDSRHDSACPCKTGPASAMLEGKQANKNKLVRLSFHLSPSQRRLSTKLRISKKTFCLNFACQRDFMPDCAYPGDFLPDSAGQEIPVFFLFLWGVSGGCYILCFLKEY